MINIVGKDITSEIHIGNQMFRRVSEMCFEKFKMKKLHIITDDNLEDLYLETLISDFSEMVYEEDSPVFNEDFEISYSVIPAGEQSKMLNTAADIYDSLAEMNFSKEDLIIAFGGGVVGDISGFVASTYLRGVKLCQIPTSLLAQVDSSVGGKNGLNIGRGKNLVGTFYQPHLVIVDPFLLQSLPEKDFSDGVAEIIKYGLIKDYSLLQKLKQYKSEKSKPDQNFDLLLNIIYSCIEAKKNFVEMDEKDNGVRNILNFGHTVGHAIEALGNYKTHTHGQGVAIGMVAALKLFKPENQNVYDELIAILDLYNLTKEIPYNAEDIFEEIKSDKKSSGEYINFISVKDFEKPEIIKIELKELFSKLLEL